MSRILLPVGSEAPDFTARNQHGEDVRLSAFRDRRSVVLVFYPYAFSGVCTGELAALRDRRRLFDEAGAEILAVSCDPMFSLRAYADASEPGFSLLSDFWPHGAVASAYQVFDEDRGCAARGTFLIDRAGLVAWSVLNAVPDARDPDEYLRVLAKLEAGLG